MSLWDDSGWQELKKFAREQGFNVKENKYILLPLGKIADHEYGICLNSAHVRPYKTEEIITSYVLKDGTVELGGIVKCYTPELVIRTAEVGDKKYVIEKQRSWHEQVNRYRGLILAFKFRNLGTIDPSFIKEVYENILKKLPEKLATNIINNGVSELEEKLEEVQKINLPENEKIIENILKEFNVYRDIAEKAEIKLNVEIPVIGEIICSKYVGRFPFTSKLEEFLEWLPKKTAEQLIIDKINELETKHQDASYEYISKKIEPYIKLAMKYDISLPVMPTVRFINAKISYMDEKVTRLEKIVEEKKRNQPK